MSASNSRIKDYSTIHHITSRIAHRVFFLGDDERNDLMMMIRRSSQFCSVKLLAWCVMANHFHLLVYLPPPEELSEEDVLQRYAILKGPQGRLSIERTHTTWRLQGESGCLRVQEWFDRQRKRMYDIGEFIKIVKQWFTEEYNRRNAHVGTLWESVYHDRLVEYKESAIETCACYIHLNPIRGAICTGYSEYPWSSMTAISRDDQMAIDGMRFIYSDQDSAVHDLVARHARMMDVLLEREKRIRAEEIARKRAAGYEVPCDPLTSEAMVAQALAQRERVINAGVEIAEATLSYRKCIEVRDNIEQQIISLVKANTFVKPGEMAKTLSIPQSTVYKCLQGLVARGVIFRTNRASPWSISEFYN